MEIFDILKINIWKTLFDSLENILLEKKVNELVENLVVVDKEADNVKNHD